MSGLIEGETLVAHVLPEMILRKTKAAVDRLAKFGVIGGTQSPVLSTQDSIPQAKVRPPAGVFFICFPSNEI